MRKQGRRDLFPHARDDEERKEQIHTMARKTAIQLLEEETRQKMKMNQQFLDDLSSRLGFSAELVGNAAYHTSLLTNQSILEIRGTVRTFHIWLQQMHAVQQTLLEDISPGE